MTRTKVLPWDVDEQLAGSLLSQVTHQSLQLPQREDSNSFLNKITNGYIYFVSFQDTSSVGKNLKCKIAAKALLYFLLSLSALRDVPEVN